MPEQIENPIWLDDGKIIEAQFCEAFLRSHPMVSVNNSFFTLDGKLSDENLLRKDIYDIIKPYVTSGLSKKVTNLLDTLRMECCVEQIPLLTDRIHVANGTLFLNGRFFDHKEFCRNRLTVNYNPAAPTPTRWVQFLQELLEPEDIVTLQEYLGYCLIPTTKAQKMLMIIGRGGEGKSRIGVVMNAIFGTNMNTTSIQKVENNRFSRADLEDKLLMVDDDMDMSALPTTNYIKSIVTTECRMDMERKGVQSYQSQLYVKFLCFGNGALTSLHDRSDGFFRRQIVLTTKDKPPGRADDPFLAEALIAEKEGIFLWMVEGLLRLIDNNFHFTISETARTNVAEAVSDGNNIVDFLNSEGYIRFKADYEVTSKDLYNLYKQWCDDNAVTPLAMRTFSSYLKQNERLYNIEYTNKVHIGGGKHVRGFVGIQLLQSPYL